jgi:hypothetical protein
MLVIALLTPGGSLTHAFPSPPNMGIHANRFSSIAVMRLDGDVSCKMLLMGLPPPSELSNRRWPLQYSFTQCVDGPLIFDA